MMGEYSPYQFRYSLDIRTVNTELCLLFILGLSFLDLWLFPHFLVIRG